MPPAPPRAVHPPSCGRCRSGTSSSSGSRKANTRLKKRSSELQRCSGAAQGARENRRGAVGGGRGWAAQGRGAAGLYASARCRKPQQANQHLLTAVVTPPRSAAGSACPAPHEESTLTAGCQVAQGQRAAQACERQRIQNVRHLCRRERSACVWRERRVRRAQGPAGPADARWQPALQEHLLPTFSLSQPPPPPHLCAAARWGAAAPRCRKIRPAKCAAAPPAGKVLPGTAAGGSQAWPTPERRYGC